jgi:hypothetical protein
MSETKINQKHSTLPSGGSTVESQDQTKTPRTKGGSHKKMSDKAPNFFAGREAK